MKIKKMTWILLAVIAGGVLLDQLTKWWAAARLTARETLPLIENVFHFTYTENTGAAFGMFKDHRWVFMVISSVAIVAIAVYLFRFSKDGACLRVGLAMVVSGGIGNMIDRIFVGYVVDFIDVRLINFAVFNVADSFVCVGAGLMILGLILDTKKAEKAKKEAQDEAPVNDEDPE